jgi:hypothetical protein
MSETTRFLFSKLKIKWETVYEGSVLYDNAVRLAIYMRVAYFMIMLFAWLYMRVGMLVIIMIYLIFVTQKLSCV